MNRLHFDCFSGMSGDMTLAALIDVGAPAEAIQTIYDSFGLPIRLETVRTRRSGISALKVTIHTEDQTSQRHLPHIEAIFRDSAMNEPQKTLAMKIFHNYTGRDPYIEPLLKRRGLDAPVVDSKASSPMGDTTKH